MPREGEATPRAGTSRGWLARARWFGAEIVVVAVGILIALALDSWWSERNEADRAAAYLVRIHEDLVADGDAMAKRLAYFADVQRFADDAIAYAERGVLRDGAAWSTLVAFFHAGQIWPYISTRRTYDEMLSAGDLRLIRDPGLREAMADYYNESEVSQGEWIFGIMPRYRERIRGMTPIAVQRYLFASCTEQTSYNTQVLLDCEPVVSESEARAILERYRAAPGLADDLRYWVSNLIVSDVIMNLSRDQALDLARRVREGAGSGL